MSYETRKKQRQKKKKIRRIITISIFIMFLLSIISMILTRNQRTILPESAVLVDEFQAQGIVIKNEKVFKFTGDNTKMSAKEGERVPAGINIGNTSLVKDISRLEKELEEVENAIETLSKSYNQSQILKKDKNKVMENQDKTIEEIQAKIVSGDYTDIDISKDKLLSNNNKLKDVSQEKTLLNQSVESLEKKKESLIKEIESSKIIYTTSSSGLISYTIDGYENIFVPRDFENYKYDDLKLPEIDSKDKSKKDKNLKAFKIIDNFEWYMAIKIDDSNLIQSFKSGNSLTLKISEDNREITGTIVAINNSEDKSVIIVKFNSYLEDYYDLRFPVISIILSKKEGLKIPTKAIVDKDGQKGVYVKEYSGIVKFRPVSIIGTEKDYTYIKKGDKKGYIDIKSQQDLVKTISLYDEIFMNPLRLKEGEILN